MRITKMFFFRKTKRFVKNQNRTEGSISAESLKGIQYINNKVFADVMGVSTRTAQKWRSRGILPYSKFSGRVYYDVNDINEMLHKCQIKPFVGKG